MGKGKPDPKQILKISGRKQFMEVMANCLNFDRIYLNFEEYDDSKPAGQRKEAQVMIYLEILEAYVLAKDIFSGKMAALAKKSKETQKAGGYKYAKEVYCKMGGTSAKQLARSGKDRKDGMSLSRQFKITPGEKQPWVVSAESGPGEENEKGLIVPKYQRPEQIIRIGMTDEQLKQFAAALELISNGWMTEKIHGFANSPD